MPTKLKVDHLDELFSKLIRLKAGGRCERCGSIPKKLDCHHFHRRRHKQVRWHEDNGIALCYGCHAYFHQNPLEEIEFFRMRLGNDKFDELHRRAQQTWPKPDRQAIGIYLKQKIKELGQA